MHSTMPCTFYHSCPFSSPSTFLHKKKSKRDCLRCYSAKFDTFHSYCLFFYPFFARTIQSACSILIQFIQLSMNTSCTHKTNSTQLQSQITSSAGQKGNCNSVRAKFERMLTKAKMKALQLDSQKAHFLSTTHTPPTLFFVFIKSAYFYSIQFLGTHPDNSCSCILFVTMNL